MKLDSILEVKYITKLSRDFYRVFHPVTGRGAYSHLSYCDKNGIGIEFDMKHLYELMIDRHSSDYKRHPMLFDDTKLFSNVVTDDVIYGFNTLDQFKMWFSHEDRELLDKLGFKLLKMSVSECIIYKKQMVIPFDHFMWCNVDEVFNLTTI